MTKTRDPEYTLQDRDLIFHDKNYTSTNYVLRVKDMPDDERPRERLAELGADNLSLAELLAVVWGVGNKNEDVLAMAKRTLREYGEKSLSNERSAKRVAEATGIPLIKASQLVASFELGRRFYASQYGRPIQVRNARKAYDYVKGMGQSQKEQLRGLYLNSRYQVIHDEVISVGTLTSNVVHPREVFQPALERGAIAIILAHNHPSGRLEPTQADIQITEQLLAAGELLGIELLDHLVVTATKYSSVMECIHREA